MPTERDYYVILGVPPEAPHEDIRRAFRAKARAAHPDLGGSARQLVIITEAWDVLRDPASRAQYDSQRRNRARSQAGPPGPARPGHARPKSKPKPKKKSKSWGNILGTFVGKAIHAFDRLTSPAKPATAAQKARIIRCAACGQKLRVRPVAGARVRCPKCKTTRAA